MISAHQRSRYSLASAKLVNRGVGLKVNKDQQPHERSTSRGSSDSSQLDKPPAVVLSLGLPRKGLFIVFCLPTTVATAATATGTPAATTAELDFEFL